MVYITLLAVLLCIGLIPQLSGSSEGDSHERLGKLELPVLPREENDVPLHTRSSENSTQVTRFVKLRVNKEIYYLDLTWRKRSVFTRATSLWAISSLPSRDLNQTIKALHQEDAYHDDLYFEDETTLASFLVRFYRKKAKFSFSGIFGLGTKTHIIKSYSGKWYTRISRKGGTLTGDEKIKNDQSRGLEDNNVANDDINLAQRVGDLKSILYVKILLIIDFQLFKIFKQNFQETFKYATVFWNAVDLRFRKMKRFDIQINITGVLIALDEHALPFLEKSRDEKNPKKLNPFLFLDESREYFQSNFSNNTGFRNFDSAFIMTALDTQPSAGMSYIGRICNRYYRAAFVQDDGSFMGLHAATHELGHQLNLYHDGSKYAANCTPHSTGGISTFMAPELTETEMFVWSRCSEDSLQVYNQSMSSFCLKKPYRT